MPWSAYLRSMVYLKLVSQNWVNQFRKECQTNNEAKEDYDYSGF
jgi:hypothetical protein